MDICWIKNNTSLLQVKVGNYKQVLGLVEYEPIVFHFPNEAIIGIAAGAFILIMIIIIILIVYKRKSTEAERQYKKMQIQLDTLESNVRNECKQGELDWLVPCQYECSLAFTYTGTLSVWMVSNFYLYWYPVNMNVH